MTKSNGSPPGGSAAEKALGALLRCWWADPGRGMTAGEIGAAIWEQRRGRVSSVNGGGDYAAQMLLGRLRKQGLVRVQYGSITSVWELTSEGRRRALATVLPR